MPIQAFDFLPVEVKLKIVSSDRFVDLISNLLSGRNIVHSLKSVKFIKKCKFEMDLSETSPEI